MNCARSVSVILLAGVALAFTAVNANADFINAYGWVSTDAIVGPGGSGATTAGLAATCGTCSPSSAQVSFTTTGLNFNFTTTSNSDNITVAAWLASDKLFPLNNLVDTIASTNMSPSIWEFTGNISVTQNEMFTIKHDDGVTFFVNNLTNPLTPLSSGPHAPQPLETAMYTGAASGSVPFELIYTECCHGSAVLQVDLPAPVTPQVPEPGSIVLLGTVVCGIVAFRRRRNARSSPR